MVGMPRPRRKEIEEAQHQAHEETPAHDGAEGAAYALAEAGDVDGAYDETGGSRGRHNDEYVFCTAFEGGEKTGQAQPRVLPELAYGDCRKYAVSACEPG